VLLRSLSAARVTVASVRATDLRTSALLELQHEWMTAKNAFIESLSPITVDRARAADGLRPSSYNYLNGTYLPIPREKTPEGRVGRARQAAVPEDRPESNDPPTIRGDVGRDRAQALSVFPFLQRLITRAEYVPVCTAIDNGTKLVDALAAHYMVSRGIVRTLRGVTARDLGRWAYQVDVIVALLKHIPADWWPRDPEAWRRYIITIDTITRTTRHPITTSSNMLWLYQAARRGFDLSIGGSEELVRLGQGIDEFLDMLRQAVVWKLRRADGMPKVAPGLRSNEIVGRVKADLGLVKLADITRRFGDAYRRATLRFVEEAKMLKGLCWPALSGRSRYGEIEVVPLTTPGRPDGRGHPHGELRGELRAPMRVRQMPDLVSPPDRRHAVVDTGDACAKQRFAHEVRVRRPAQGIQQWSGTEACPGCGRPAHQGAGGEPDGSRRLPRMARDDCRHAAERPPEAGADAAGDCRAGGNAAEEVGLGYLGRGRACRQAGRRKVLPGKAFKGAHWVSLVPRIFA
jgi:hypothetical protein